MVHGKPALALAALALLLSSACRLAAAPGGDPEAALKAINEWYSAQIRQAQDEKKTPDFRALVAERVAKAKAALEGVDIGGTEPAKCFALAQLYQIAGMTKEAGAAADRFLTSNPDARMKYSAQSLVLSGKQASGDAEGIVKLLDEMKPPDNRGAAYLAATTAATYSETVAAKLGPQAALDLIARVEGRVPFDQMTGQQDKQAAEMAIVRIAIARSDLLQAKGDDAGALAALEAGKKRLSADSRVLRQIDSKIKQAALIGQPAPELKKDRQYGEFASLASLKGRVVVLDFGAHW